MSLRFVARIVFIVALAFSLSAPMTANAKTCDPGTTGLC